MQQTGSTAQFRLAAASTGVSGFQICCAFEITGSKPQPNRGPTCAPFLKLSGPKAGGAGFSDLDRVA